MRIIAGIYKNRSLQYKSKNLRPTSDKVREALFNILGDRLVKARFLDLYAGSGAIGLEAFSRGASKVVFVETFPELVLANLKGLSLLEKAKVVRLDVLKTIALLSKKKEQFDLIFLDPPYDSHDLESTMKKLGDLNLLAPEGLVIVEHRKHQSLAVEYGRLKQYRVELYGESELGFYHLCP